MEVEKCAAAKASATALVSKVFFPAQREAIQANVARKLKMRMSTEFLTFTNSCESFSDVRSTCGSDAAICMNE